MNVDIDFLLKSVHARNEVNKWLTNRPYTGLDVTDVASLVDGFDYLGKLLAELTGQDITKQTEQIEQPTIQVTYLDGE